jgi:uncharacterized protein YfaS (alpha-2-macroglobulin family)
VINPSTVKPGENVNIYLKMTNTGEANGTDTVVLKINNAFVSSQNVTLAGGVSTAVTFTTSSQLTGNYAVDVAGLSGSFIVSNSKSAPWYWPVIVGVTVLGIILGVLIGIRRYSKP